MNPVVGAGLTVLKPLLLYRMLQNGQLQSKLLNTDSPLPMYLSPDLLRWLRSERGVQDRGYRFHSVHEFFTETAKKKWSFNGHGDFCNMDIYISGNGLRAQLVSYRLDVITKLGCIWTGDLEVKGSLSHYQCPGHSRSLVCIFILVIQKHILPSHSA